MTDPVYEQDWRLACGVSALDLCCVDGGDGSGALLGQGGHASPFRCSLERGLTAQTSDGPDAHTGQTLEPDRIVRRGVEARTNAQPTPEHKSEDLPSRMRASSTGLGDVSRLLLWMVAVAQTVKMRLGVWPGV
jgi:hypothetical protein